MSTSHGLYWEAGGTHCVVLLHDVLRPGNGCLLELDVSPVRAGPWSSNVDTVVVEHQVRVSDAQSSADVHQLVKVHDGGLEAPAEAVIEEPVPAGEAGPCGQDRLWLGLSCVWRGRPLIAVGFLTPRIAQRGHPHGLPQASLCQNGVTCQSQIQACLSIHGCCPYAHWPSSRQLRHVHGHI